MQCDTCGNEYEKGAKFCKACGAQYPASAELPRIGVSAGRGNYLVVFDPVLREFETEEEANEAARKTLFDGGPFEKHSVRLVHSLVPPEMYPFICDACREMVAAINHGRCGNCDEVKWISRTRA